MAMDLEPGRLEIQSQLYYLCHIPASLNLCFLIFDMEITSPDLSPHWWKTKGKESEAILQPVTRCFCYDDR